MAKMGDYFKTFFFLLLLVQFAPVMLMSIKKQYAQLLEPSTKVGLIIISGMLTDADYYEKNLKRFFKDPEIKSIVLHFKNGIGGVAGTAQTLFYDIKELKTGQSKPIITFVENSCVSAAYYVACATDYIVATPSAFIGSIGVYIPQPHFKDFIEQFKISYSVVKTGKYKTVGDPFLATTPEQEALLQSLTNDTYEHFVRDVSQSRPKLATLPSTEYAEGKIFTGHQALIGLIDEMGGMMTVERVIREKVSVEGKIEWVRPQPTSALARLFGASEEPYEESYMEAALRKVEQYVRTQLSLQVS